MVGGLYYYIFFIALLNIAVCFLYYPEFLLFALFCESFEVSIEVIWKPACIYNLNIKIIKIIRRRRIVFIWILLLLRKIFAVPFRIAFFLIFGNSICNMCAHRNIQPNKKKTKIRKWFSTTPYIWAYNTIRIHSHIYTSNNFVLNEEILFFSKTFCLLFSFTLIICNMQQRSLFFHFSTISVSNNNIKKNKENIEPAKRCYSEKNRTNLSQ